MHLSRTAAVTAILVGALVAAPASSRAGEIERFVPASAHLAILTDNLAATAREWQRTALGRLLRGEQFSPLRKSLASRAIAAPPCLQPWLGFDWPELATLDCPAACIEFSVGGGEAASALIFLDPKPSGAARQLLAAGQAHFHSRGFRSVVESIGGTQLIALTPSRTTRPGSRSAPAYFTTGTVVGVASSRAAGRWLLHAYADAQFASLAADGEFRAVVQPLAAAAIPSVCWWLQPLPLWSDLRASAPAPPHRDWLALLRRQGGTALRAAGGVVLFPPAGLCDLEVRGQCLVTRPLTKAARLLDARPGPAAPMPRWVANDVTAWAAWRWDVPSGMQVFGGLFDDLTEPGPKGEGLFEDVLDGLRDDPEGPRLDIRRAVFPHLGPEMFEISDNAGRRSAANPRGSRWLAVVQCRDASAILKAVTRFYQGDELVKSENLGRIPLWTVGEGHSLLVEGQGDALPDVRALAVTDTALILANDPEMLKSRLDAKDAPRLETDRSYLSFVKWLELPENPPICHRGFLWAAPWLEGAYEVVRSQGSTAREDWQVTALRLLLTGSRRVEPGFPYQQLPAFAGLRGGLSVVVTSISATPAGFGMRIGVLRQTPHEE